MKTAVPGPTIEDRPTKIGDRHLERLAVVYVRQSSLYQVQHNQESTRLQYSLEAMARELGWEAGRVLVLDDDLGTSGKAAAGRQDFQRLLAEVALDHVGIILGVEMSRLARSNKDWHHLLELCARFGTLIADLDGLYDPSRYNDRLLLGLKGTMSEAELHLLRQRLLQGKLQKARRGELSKAVPSGYLLQASGEVVLDADESVRAAIRFVFEQFERLGTAHAVLRALVEQEFQIGVRRRTGIDRGSLEWHHPNRTMVVNILRNPIYAGAYVYGRRQTDPRRQQPGRPATGRTPLVEPANWQACVRDHFPAYITWEQFERNQARLKANRKLLRAVAVRSGTALLQGLVRCGRCNLSMSVQYAKYNGRVYPRYICSRRPVIMAAMSARPSRPRASIGPSQRRRSPPWLRRRWRSAYESAPISNSNASSKRVTGTSASNELATRSNAPSVSTRASNPRTGSWPAPLSVPGKTLSARTVISVSRMSGTRSKCPSA